VKRLPVQAEIDLADSPRRKDGKGNIKIYPAGFAAWREFFYHKMKSIYLKDGYLLLDYNPDPL
jgi:hypothetical protein